MRLLVITLLCIFVSQSSLSANKLINTDFQVIAYHDVRDTVEDRVDVDQYAISTRNLIDHFSWLRDNNFTPVTIDAILAAREGRQALPENAVLLTFDDGFLSAYTHVLPLLKLFEYPAVISIVTGWINGDSAPPTGDPTLENHEFLSWQQLREMQASGLIEIASHSHDLHRGSVANPQGNEQPSSNTRRYIVDRYETRDEYIDRIYADLQRSVELITEETGVAPRVMTWPYGAYNADTVDIANRLGMSIALTLDSFDNKLDSLKAISRHLIQANPEVVDLGFDLLHPQPPPVYRAAQVDLDYIYDSDPEQQEENLGLLLDRMKSLQISHVFLQAFADPDADGSAQAVYFANRHLPVRADLFNRVMWQLRTRAGVQVYAWLPILGFDSEHFDASLQVTQQIQGTLLTDANAEPRLSPFSAEARKIIQEIYEDLALSAPIAGILFHDDGRLNEFEDASRHALAAYESAFGEDFSIPSTLADPDLQSRWARFKTEAIIDHTQALMDVVRRYQPQARFARNLFSGTLLDPQGEIYLSQNFDLFLQTYDQIALMAMPYFENAADPKLYFENLIKAVAAQPQGLQKTIFELQTVNWQTNTPIPAIELRDTMRWLQAHGVRHLGYYPDDFITGTPALRELRQGMSLAVYPVEVPQ